MVNGKIQANACKIQAAVSEAVAKNILLRIEKTELNYPHDENEHIPGISVPCI